MRVVKHIKVKVFRAAGAGAAVTHRPSEAYLCEVLGEACIGEFRSGELVRAWPLRQIICVEIEHR